MATSRNRLCRRLLFLASGLVWVGCTSARPAPLSGVPAALRDRVGIVVVVARDARVEINVRPPATAASGALTGLGCGALVGLEIGARGGGGSVLTLITAPAGLVIGAIAGGAIAVAKAPPADMLRAADA